MKQVLLLGHGWWKTKNRINLVFCPNKVKKACDIIHIWIIVQVDVQLCRAQFHDDKAV